MIRSGFQFCLAQSSRSLISRAGAIALVSSLASAHSAQAASSICDAAPGNLIANCGLELGAVAQGSLGFTSSYAYTSDLLPAGTFYVGSNPDLYNGFFGSPTASPNSGSYEMIINGSTGINQLVWQENAIPVLPNTTYYFSVYASPVDAISPAILDFSANGLQLGSDFTLTQTPGVWDRFFATWASGANTSVTLSLVDQSTAAGGNDFALDDFIFNTQSPMTGAGVGGTGGSTAPEASTWAMMLIGFAGLGGFLRRARKRAAVAA